MHPILSIAIMLSVVPLSWSISWFMVNSSHYPWKTTFRSFIHGDGFYSERIIHCAGAVHDEMANIIVAQLLYLDALDPQKDIVMYMNSPGGSVTAGMAIFDTMKHIQPDVYTVCVGQAAGYYIHLH